MLKILLKQFCFWGFIFIFSLILCSDELSAQVSSDYQYIFSSSVPADKFKVDKRRNSLTCSELDPNRSPEGSCNNMDEGEFGMRDISFHQLMTPVYGPNGGMGGVNRKSPREISNLVANQPTSILSDRGLSTFVFSFFQFVDHNITATPAGSESAPIAIPAGDPFFDPFNTGVQTMDFNRSEPMPGTTIRKQRNVLTSWMDGVAVYGETQEKSDWLRSFTDGKLKSSSGNLLPCNTLDGECDPASPIDIFAPEMDGDVSRCGTHQRVFVAGDFRANEQPGLLTIHTLFMREHNRVCDELVAAGMMDDEEIYQRARKIVTAKIQAITYNELLPALGVTLDEYTGYDPSIRPDIYSLFSTAAFRLGHTMVPEELVLVNDDCTNVVGTTGCGPADGECSCTSTDVNIDGKVGLKDAFFHPSLVSNIGIEPILKGMTVQVQEKIDAKVVGALRNFLFGPPGAGGLDLVSLNIQRGRDHGLPDYNAVRQHFLGSGISSFADITSDVTLQNALSTAYDNDINEIDVWLGLLCEDHVPGTSVGPTLYAILKDQFQKLRNADRFWMDMDPMFSDANKEEIHNTTLSELIKLNTTIGHVQQNVFFARTCDKAQDVALTVENTCGRVGGWIKVPVTVENFNNVLEAEMHFDWEDDHFVFMQHANFAFSEGNFEILTNDPDNFGFRWTSNLPTGQTLADGETLIEIELYLTGWAGDVSEMSIVNPQFKGVAGSIPDFDIPIHTQPGMLCTKAYPNKFGLNGNVVAPDGVALSQIRLMFNKNNGANISRVHLDEGTAFYSKQANSGDIYQVYPLSRALPNRSAITVYDLTLIADHVYGSKPFHNAYQYLAADVNLNDRVDINDARQIMKVMLGDRRKFKGGQAYRFFSTAKMPELNAPFDIEEDRWYEPLEKHAYGENFMGVPKGRVADMGDVHPLLMKDAPIVEAIHRYNFVEQQAVIKVPVTALNLKDVSGYQFTVDWDPVVLEYSGFEAAAFEDMTDEDNLGFERVHRGELEVAWFDSLGTYKTFNNETVLFYVIFNVIGYEGSHTDLKINSESIEQIILDKDLKMKTVTFADLTITVVGDTYESSHLYGIKSFPNPFRNYTNIQFEVNFEQEVTIDVFNSFGQLVRSNTGTYRAGEHQFKFRSLDLATGIYQCRITGADGSKTIPLSLIR